MDSGPGSTEYERMLAAARYVFHKVVTHKYAVAQFHGRLTADEAVKRYNAAMANYDSIVASANHPGKQQTQKANAQEVVRGSLAIADLIKEFKEKGGVEDV